MRQFCGRPQGGYCRDPPSTVDLIAAISPVSFRYRDADRPTYGFIAENLAAIDPHFIGYFDDAGEPRTVNTASILAVTVTALQELYGTVSQLATTVAGLARSIFSEEIAAGTRSCVGSTCVTESEFRALPQDSAAPHSPAAPVEPPPASPADAADDPHEDFDDRSPEPNEPATDALSVDATATSDPRLPPTSSPAQPTASRDIC